MGLFTRKPEKSELTAPNISNFCFIKQINLTSSRDMVILRNDLLEGNIMVVNLRIFFDDPQNQKELQLSLHTLLQQIKQYCLKTGGSVLKLKEHLLIITPNNQFILEHH